MSYSLDRTPPPRLLEKDASDLIKLGHRRHVPRHEQVFRAGDQAINVFLLERGQVKIFQCSPSGQQVLLFFRSEGEIIGIHESVLGGGRRIHCCTAQASEDSVICAVPLDRFIEFLTTRSSAAQYVIEALSFRLNESSEKLASFAAADIGSRVARIILHMSACYGQHVGGQAVEVGVPLTQQELANVVGAARQTVNGIIKALKADGIISVTKQHVRVEDEARLRRIALRDHPDDDDDV